MLGLAVLPPLLRPARGSPGGVQVPLGLGLEFWWTADSGHDASGAIASWRDVIGGLELTASGSGRPAYSATGCGGRPAIVLDGIDDFLTIAGRPELDLGASRTIAVVLESSSAVDQASALSRYSTTLASSLWWLQVNGSALGKDGASAMSESGTNTTRFSLLTGSSGTSTDPSSGAGQPRSMTLSWTGSSIVHYTGRTAASGGPCTGAKSADATPLEVGRLATASPVYCAMSIRHILGGRRGDVLSAARLALLWDWMSADCGVP